MLKTSTLKPFDKGDIFLGLTYLNNPDDDHAGEGRILQFDKEWRPKGTLYVEETTYLIVGCNFGPDGTLWGFDSQGHVVMQVSPDGQVQNIHTNLGRGFGSVSFDNEGNHYFGEYFIDSEIWKGTSAKKTAEGKLGDGNIYKFNSNFELLQTFDVETAPEFTGFKGVTHSTMHPSKEFITYTTETSRRLMRYDIVNDKQLDDLDSYPEADPHDRDDKRWFIAPYYMDDGRLLCTASDGLRVYAVNGELAQTIELPGYGWAQCSPDADPQYAVAANIWTGLAARIDLDKGEMIESIDSGFTAPFRSLAGIAVYR